MNLESIADDELAAALDAYLAAFEAGESVDPEEWVARHPAIADRLRACLRGLHLVEAAAESISVAPAIPRPMATDPPEPGLIRIGDFEVVREVGRGGMGVVYEAIENPLGRRVALKVLPIAAVFDPRQIARFRVEAQAASQLAHPNIVPVYSVGCREGVHYYAMQLIDGPTLAQWIIARRRRAAGDPTASTELDRPGETSDFREAARLARQAAEALEHAHQQGVLHRDVKPSNLMVDARGHLWITDFGLARFQHSDSSLTAPGDLLGTLRYMSPEQASADHASVDRRSDVYSLGATLYELATLRPVFDGTDRAELIRRILHDDPRPPRAHRRDLPRDLETIVLKAMAKEPSGRYESAQAMADDLQKFLDDRPILARRPGPVERSARWARRHAAALAVALPVLGASVLAMAIACAFALREEARARAAAADSRQTVDRMYTRVAEEWLGRRPALQPVQREFLLEVLAYYQRFAAEPGADLATRAGVGIAALRVGEIQRTLGRPDEAAAAYRQAIASLAPIPEAEGALEALGKAGGGLGQLLVESGRPDEAKPVLAEAVDRTRRYAESPALDAPHRAAAWHRLGTLFKLSGREAEAEAAYRRTIELADPIGGPIGRKMQAGVHGNLGVLLSTAGRRDDAERALTEAVRLYEAILRDEPEMPLYRRELASATAQLGALAAERPGGRREAERLIRRSIELRDRLAADSPDVPAYREELARALLGLAGLLDDDGRPAEAEPFAARSVALLEELQDGDRSGTSPSSLQRPLIEALERHGALLMLVARPVEAERALRRALDLRGPTLSGTTDQAIATDRVRLSGLLSARGELSEARRQLEAAADAESLPTARAHVLMRAVRLAGRDVSLSTGARDRAMRADAVRAIEALRGSVDSGDDPVAPYLLAWYLTSCPVEDLRDASSAIAIARGLLERAPGSWAAWAALGAACYRDGDADAAVDALDRAAGLNQGELLHYGYFLAMARHRIGESGPARDAFDRADRVLPPDDEIARLRAEAAGVLGIEAGVPALARP